MREPLCLRPQVTNICDALGGSHHTDPPQVERATARLFLPPIELLAQSKRRDEILTDRLDRDSIVVGLRLYPILFMHFGTPAVIAADPHLLMV
jgi:hypothetical protein